MTTFEDARERAREALADEWTLGTLYISTEGYEDASMYLVNAGAREAVIGMDLNYLDTIGLSTFVAKIDGRVYRLPTIENLDRIEGMTLCGTPDPAE